MEASHGTEPRVIRLRDAPDAIELETTDLLDRLEVQAEENGRLAARAESFERVARAERDARRRLSDTLKRERKAARALHERAEQAEAALAAKTEDAAHTEQALALSEQQRHLIWMQLTEASRQVELLSRPMWRRLLRRPPKA
jgi:hypothetical protein